MDLGNEEIIGGKYRIYRTLIAIKHLVGTDLDKVLAEEGPLPITTAVDYVLEACEAIAEAHASGIIHRDLKPRNLFFTRRPSGAPLVKVLDFGTGTAIASPAYMSPEQIRSAKNVDVRADVWSLGVVLHELVSGRLPFEAPNAPALLAKIIADAPVPLRQHLPGAPRDLEAVILRCLEKAPERRPADIAELAALLAPFAGASSPRVAPISRTGIVPPPSRRRVRVVAALALAGLVLGGGAAALSLRPRRGSDVASVRVPDAEPRAVPSPVTTAEPRVTPESEAPPASSKAVETSARVQPSRRPRLPAQLLHAAPRPAPPPEHGEPPPPPVDPMGDRN
jgi:serine/threonine-protein kinase